MTSMPTRPKAVLDTTVLVSAFLVPGGAAAQLLFHAGYDFTLALSPDILDELVTTLLTKPKIRKSYIFTDGQVYEYATHVVELTGLMAHTVEPLVGVVRDPKDDMIIACAITVGADFIVSRDKDLLSLTSYQGVAIISPRQFLDSFSAT